MGVTWAEEMANNGKIIVVAALDGTFQRKPFGDILSLIPLSEEVTKLNAVCMNCFGDAAFSKRITQSDGEKVEVIGGADKYMAVCRGVSTAAVSRWLPVPGVPSKQIIVYLALKLVVRLKKFCLVQIILQEIVMMLRMLVQLRK